MVWFNVFYDVLLGLWALIGAVWVVLAWRHYAHKAQSA